MSAQEIMQVATMLTAVGVIIYSVRTGFASAIKNEKTFIPVLFWCIHVSVFYAVVIIKTHTGLMAWIPTHNWSAIIRISFGLSLIGAMIIHRSNDKWTQE